MENLGIATGFPFGRYHFEVASNLPHIGAVPIIVGPLYFAMGYFSWIIASILLGQADLKLDRAFYRLALPIVAAFVMVQWDVVMDPPNATLGHAWVWHDGGGYFGVPLSNFLGWYLTVWLFYQAFALVLGRFGLQRISRHRPLDHDDFGLNQSKIIVIDSNKLERDEEKREPAFRRNQVYADCVNLPAYPALCREFLLIPILLYFSVALSLAVPYFTENTREIVDIAGTKWNAHNLRETAAIIALFTMVFTSVLALIRLVEETPSRHLP
jgi:putative membrane protein